MKQLEDNPLDVLAFPSLYELCKCTEHHPKRKEFVRAHTRISSDATGPARPSSTRFMMYRVPLVMFANYVRFEVITAVAMKNGVFWDVPPCGACKNRRSSETSVLTSATRRNIAEDTILLELIRLPSQFPSLLQLHVHSPPGVRQ
jgi:hypothetical protein